MDAIGNVQTSVIPLPAFTSPASGANAAANAAAQITPASGQGTDTGDSDSDTLGQNALGQNTLGGEDLSAAAAQKQFDSVQKAAQSIVNTEPLGNQTFTIYKDSSGQLITRFFNLSNGKVTYLPQPTVFKLGGSSDAPAVLKINA